MYEFCLIKPLTGCIQFPRTNSSLKVGFKREESVAIVEETWDVSSHIQNHHPAICNIVIFWSVPNFGFWRAIRVNRPVGRWVSCECGSSGMSKRNWCLSCWSAMTVNLRPYWNTPVEALASCEIWWRLLSSANHETVTHLYEIERRRNMMRWISLMVSEWNSWFLLSLGYRILPRVRCDLPMQIIKR